MKIRGLLPRDYEKICQLSGKVFGDGFLNVEDKTLSMAQSSNLSFVLEDNDEIFGYRLTYSPGEWIDEFEKNLNISSWNQAKEKVAYFKTICLAEEARGSGWGKKLSLTSIEALKKVGARAVICHSWKEEPKNASFLYLTNLNFKKIAEYPGFWNTDEYSCIICQPSACQCTAIEMILHL